VSREFPQKILSLFGGLFSGDSGDFRGKGGEILSPQRDYMLRGFRFELLYSEGKCQKQYYRK